MPFNSANRVPLASMLSRHGDQNYPQQFGRFANIGGNVANSNVAPAAEVAPAPAPQPITGAPQFSQLWSGQDHGNGGHAPGGLGSATPGGADAGLGNSNGSGMGPAAPGVTIGDALMNAMSPVGTLAGALLGNNTFSPAGSIPTSLANIGRGLLSGNTAANGYGGAVTGAAAAGRAAAGGQAGGIGGGRGGVGGNGPMGGNGGQGANAGF